MFKYSSASVRNHLIAKSTVIKKHIHIDDFNFECFKYLIMNPSDNFEISIKRFMEINEITIPEEVFFSLLHLQPILLNVIYYYRHLVIETIISPGIVLHVFGS